ncbi:Probable RNA-directed DNA polymerase from transposon BS [Eumeta japonica]|uniref:Probable RNA-directed DNA polymerase from transposon BS n=1 Tax=Eumeta variegata TaxID=151549 RepID=A0A4C1ZFF8_EUMVA|nr:Probable RNA-directed DNA polymerase from transposon BS [Eumeta japonica]
MFNACLQNCDFPPAWKEAEVIGIHKPGKPRDLPASYRPISALSGLAKLFERVLKTHLSDHLLGKGLIIDEQYGFRPAHSCPQQVLRLVEYVTEGFKNKHKTVDVFFDVAKAFDRRAIDKLGQWFRLWRIEVNPEKSAAIQFKYSKRRNKFVVDYDTPNLKMLNARIPWQQSYKYLGVTLDRNLLFRDHIVRVKKTALFYRARLGAMLGRKSKLSRRNKRTIYKMCIRTVMTYASPVFVHAAPKTLYKLRIIQNKFCRSATDAHWCVLNSVLHRDLELPTISKYKKDASKRFLTTNRRLLPILSVGLEPSTQLIDGPLEVRTDVALGSAAQIEGGVVGEQRQPDA